MKQTDSHLFFYAYQTLNRNFSLAFLCFTSCLSYSYRLHFKQLQHLQAAATGSAVATVRLPAYGASMQVNLTRQAAEGQTQALAMKVVNGKIVTNSFN